MCEAALVVWSVLTSIGQQYLVQDMNYTVELTSYTLHTTRTSLTHWHTRSLAGLYFYSPEDLTHTLHWETIFPHVILN